MIDSYKYQGLRKNLVKELRLKGIEDEQVLSVIEKVPRHFFIENAFHHNYAYSDEAFPIGLGQTISHPYTVAFQTSLLEIKKGDKILEIGTGSGYQTAVLVEMGAKVFSIERHKELSKKAKIVLDEMNYFPKLFFGDGYKGLPSYAPFDKIIVTAGGTYVPDALKEQLKVNGVLVIPIGEGDDKQMNKLIKLSDTDFSKQELGSFKFVPFLENKQP